MMRRKKGQSTVEFALVIIAFVFFLSLSYNAVISFSVYQYLSYVTFMTARSYQPGRDAAAQQVIAAKRTMATYLGQPGAFEYGTKNIPLKFGDGRALALIKSFTGPNANQSTIPFVLIFEVPLVTLPLSQNLRAAFGTLTLSTESNLGREPTGGECRSFFSGFFGSFGGGGVHNADGMEDNGC